MKPVQNTSTETSTISALFAITDAFYSIEIAGYTYGMTDDAALEEAMDNLVHLQTGR